MSEDRSEANPGTESTDYFADLNRIRADQDPWGTGAVKQVVYTVSVRKPDKRWFFRAHPEYGTFDVPAVYMFTPLDDRDSPHLVLPEYAEAFKGTLSTVSLVPCMNHCGMPFCWPYKHVREGKRESDYHRSVQKAIELAQHGWVKVVWDNGAYKVYNPLNGRPAPEFPDWDIREWYQKAFFRRVVDREDHPLLVEQATV